MLTPEEKQDRAAALADARNRERLERYEAAINKIAAQNLTVEMDEDQHEHADYEGAYNTVVQMARRAIEPQSE